MLRKNMAICLVRDLSCTDCNTAVLITFQLQKCSHTSITSIFTFDVIADKVPSHVAMHDKSRDVHILLLISHIFLPQLNFTYYAQIFAHSKTLSSYK